MLNEFFSSLLGACIFLLGISGFLILADLVPRQMRTFWGWVGLAVVILLALLLIAATVSYPPLLFGIITLASFSAGRGSRSR